MPVVLFLAAVGLVYLVLSRLIDRLRGGRSDAEERRARQRSWGPKSRWEYLTNFIRYRDPGV